MRSQTPEVAKMSPEELREEVLELREEVLKLREESARKDAVVDEANKQMRIFWEINNQLKIKITDLEKKLGAANAQLLALPKIEEQLTSTLNELIEFRSQENSPNKTTLKNASPTTSPTFYSLGEKNISIQPELTFDFAQTDILRGTIEELKKKNKIFQDKIQALANQNRENKSTTEKLEDELNEAKQEIETLNRHVMFGDDNISALNLSIQELVNELAWQQAENKLLQEGNEQLRILNEKPTSRAIASNQRKTEKLSRLLTDSYRENEYLKEQVKKLQMETENLKKQMFGLRRLKKPSFFPHKNKFPKTDTVSVSSSSTLGA